MKKIDRFVIIAFCIIMSIMAIIPLGVYAQRKIGEYDISQNNSVFNQNPIGVLDSFHNKANNSSSDRVQRTDLDTISSGPCKELSVDGRFTITRTLCNIKASVGDYLQYIMYIGLAAATILLIWNGFKLVTSSDREKQMTTFKKNLIYIIIGVVLLVAFYFIIDVFVSFVNLVAE